MCEVLPWYSIGILVLDRHAFSEVLLCCSLVQDLYDKCWKTNDELSALKKRVQEDVRTAERSAEVGGDVSVESSVVVTHFCFASQG